MRFHLSFLWIIFLILAIVSNVVKTYLFIFFFLFVHEMGHVVVAKLLKYHISDIHVYPFGFSATIEHFNHAHPFEIILILIAGFGLHFIFPLFISYLCEIGLVSISYKGYLMQVNTSILLFNLFPIYPLDGGRVLFAILRFFSDYKTSKAIVLFISFVFVFVLICISSFSMKMILFFLVYILVKEVKRFDLDLVEFNYYQRKYFKVNQNHV